MWFWLSLIALLFWSGSDLFSKIGSKPDDKYSHWKMSMAVGLIMGIHAAYEIFIGGVEISLHAILAYLPASFMYILSMVIGYIALRFTELSISSPICNSSGAIAAILCFVFLHEAQTIVQVIGILLVAAGVIGLGFAEMKESDEARFERQKSAKVQYRKSWIALVLPILYCLIDALGTFFDSVILREEDTETFLDTVFPHTLDEGVANVAYELTWLAIGIVAAVYVLVVKREKLTLRREGPKVLGGICETAGQFAYIYALGDTLHSGFAAAIISAYCAVSVLWSRIFLREKLSWKHYTAILVAVCGIVLLGIYDG